jgi:hypothetical protein
MQAVPGWGLGVPLVHLIDREADSVGHLRAWDAAGHLFLVRADDRRVLWHGQKRLLSDIVRALRRQKALRQERLVTFQGQQAQQWVAETTVTLYRPAKQRRGNHRKQVPGRRLELRLVVSLVRDACGRVLATWMLLTNVPAAQADAGTMALWYYWRWNIESFFKLLKSGGQQLEHWQQETGSAIARRLLIASMACVVVWDLQRQISPQAQKVKQLLVHLSGRQMKRSSPCTPSALLAGLFVLLPMLELLRTHARDLAGFRQRVLRVLPFLDTR